MYKRGLAILVIGIMLGSLIGCVALSKNDEIVEKPSIRGVVTSINRDYTGNLVSFFVEGDPSEDLSYNIAEIKMTDGTSIRETGERITQDDLYIGMTIEAWFSESVADSYPVQGEAQRIRVLNQQEVTLNFNDIKPEVLKVGKPEEDWVLEALIDFSSEFDGRMVEVYLYLKDYYNPLGGDIVAFLLDEDTMYEIGVVASYGIRSLLVEVEDVTSRGKGEILLTGSKGTTYVETNIIGEDNFGNWVLWLSGGSYSNIDLDGNGEEELVATSRGSIPPYVVIYRWNGEVFQWADVSSALGGNYANLLEIGNEFIIESGMWKMEEGSGEFIISNREYIYQDGSLIWRNDN